MTSAKKITALPNITSIVNWHHHIIAFDFRTKNPVLPSIHAESCLVVPEPNTLKYPAVAPAGLLFTAGLAADSAADDTAVEQLTELRGSLFLSDEYGQQYFQPWN